MKSWGGILILIAALCLTEVSQVPNSHALSSKGSLVLLRVKSPEKDFPVRDVYVLTPDLPAKEVNSLPVVYMLHGWPGSPQGLIAGVETSLLSAFAKGAAPFIAVFPDGNALTHSDSEWADSYDGKAKIETWLTTNVIHAVEGRNLRSRNNRAILGFSMGGYGAAIIGLHHPKLFGQVVTLAGYFVIDDLTNAFDIGPSTDSKHKYQTPSNYLKNAKQLRWFLAESNQDYTQLIRGQAASWGLKLKKVSSHYTLSSASGGHSYVFVGAEIPSILKWFKWSTRAAPIPIPSASALPGSTPSNSLPSPKSAFL